MARTAGGADADEKTPGNGEPAGCGEIGQSDGHGRGDGPYLRAVAIVIDPAGTATLIAHGGRQAIIVCVGTIMLTFAIGATLTGAIFIFAEGH